MAKRPGATRRQFSREYKLEAVRRVSDGGRAPSVVARELGINPNMLRTWRRQLTTAGAAAGLGGSPLTSQDEEIRRLRRENAVLKQERDFLKSATVFFAKESR
jgi:transposase